jgi:hypothetical protein
MPGFSGMGVPGTLAITSAGLIGISTSDEGKLTRNGFPIVIRVFDLAVGTTVGSIALYDNTSATGGPLLFACAGTNQNLHSEAGYLFRTACYANPLSGGSGSVNFIVEVK